MIPRSSATDLFGLLMSFEPLVTRRLADLAPTWAKWFGGVLGVGSPSDGSFDEVSGHRPAEGGLRVDRDTWRFWDLCIITPVVCAIAS